MIQAPDKMVTMLRMSTLVLIIMAIILSVSTVSSCGKNSEKEIKQQQDKYNQEREARERAEKDALNYQNQANTFKIILWIGGAFLFFLGLFIGSGWGARARRAKNQQISEKNHNGKE